jgi:hypothetical protein
MTEKDFKAGLSRFMDVLRDLTDGYEKANPEWTTITYLQILRDALENLKRLVEDPEEKEITWELPGAELAYPIKANWEEAEPYYFDVTAEDIEDPGKAAELLGKGLETLKRLYVLRKATREILIIKKGGKYFYKVPQALQDKLAKLSEEKQVARIEKILKPATKLKEAPAIGIKAGGKAGRAILVYGIGPALLDIDKKEAHYPIAIGLDFKGIKAKDLGPGPVSEILDGILKELGKITPPEDLSFVKDLWPAHKADKARAAAPLVKASLRVELQKWGHRPKPKQGGLFDALLDDTQKNIKEKSIDVFGIDITQAQEQALHAIQDLLTKTNYMGNIPGAEMIDQGFHFTGYLPALEFTPAEYLEAYGLTKYQTGRGKDEYSSAERALALGALVDLAKKSFLFVYKRHYWKENEKTKQREPVIDRIETIAPLIKVMRGWEALTRAEDKSLDAGAATEKTDEKLTSIAIQPAPIMVQDINNLFVLKRANYAQEIKFLAPHASKYTYRLINWLMTQAELKRRAKEPLTIKENIEEIAYHLRMDAYVKTRQFKRIRQILTKSYKIAQDLGYLLSYSTVQGQTKDLERLELNPDKYGVRAGNPGPELPKGGGNSPGGGLPNAGAGST